MNNIIARQPAGVPTGGQFASTTHDEPSIHLPASLEKASLGVYEVDAHSLQTAHEAWAAVGNEPEQRLHQAAREWAEKRGYKAETWDYFPAAEQAHCSGAVLISERGAAIALSGQGRRNFSVDLNGDGETLGSAKNDGFLEPITFIYT